MQGHQQGGGLHRGGRMAKVVGAKPLKVKLFLGRAFPQKIHFQRLGHCLRLRLQFPGAGARILQQHVGWLDLASLAMRRLYLKAVALVSEYGGDLESAIFFVKYIHDAGIIGGSCRVGRKTSVTIKGVIPRRRL